MRCTHIKKDGTRCLAKTLRGEFDKCVWHVDQTVRQEIWKKPLSKQQMMMILSSQIKELRREKNVNKLEKTREIRACIDLLNSLSGENKNDNADGETLEQYVARKYGKQS
jgi:hypothetical protein